MKSLILIPIFALSLTAQVSSFPGAIADAHKLKIAGNNLVTKLVKAVTAGDTVFVIANAAGIVPDMLLTVETEAVSVTSVTGNLVTVARGFDSTTPVAHAAGKPISANVTAWHHNTVAAEIAAIENALGTGLSNLPRGRNLVVPEDYAFTAQTPAVALVASVVSVIPMAPCPLGVAGTDRQHYLAFSGGGAANSSELITGGTCTSGAPTGNLVITPTLSRTAGFSVASATLGIQEAANALPSAGGTVSLAASTYTLNATIAVDKFRRFVGTGPGTKIVPASCSATAFTLLSQPTPTPSGFPVYNTGGYDFRDFMIDGHACNGINSQIGFGSFAGSDTTTETLFQSIRIDNVYLNNVGQGVHFERSRGTRITNSRAFANTRIVFTDTAAGFTAGNHTFEADVENFSYRSGCYLTTDCAPTSLTSAVLQFNSVEVGSIKNVYFEGQGTNFFANIGIQVTGQTEDFNIDQVSSNLWGIVIDLEAGAFLGQSFYPGYMKISHCALDGLVTNGIKFGDGIGNGDFQQVHNVQVTDCTFSNMTLLAGSGTDYVYVGYASRNISFIQNEFSGLRANQRGLHLAAGNVFIAVIGNTFDTFTAFAPIPSVVGILIDATAQDFQIVNNQFSNLTNTVVDNSGPMPGKVIASNTPMWLNPTAMPIWQHVRVTKVANGVSGCANAAGCFVTTEPVTAAYAAPAAATLQIIVKNPPGAAPLYVSAIRMKAAAACTGTTTLMGSLGSVSNPTFYTGPYDLMAAVGPANFAPYNGILNNYGSSYDVDYVTLNLTSTGGNLSQVANGCTVDIRILAASLPN